MVGDEVYGGTPKLRARPEEHGISYVMAVACSGIIAMAADGMRADEAVGLVPGDVWQRLSCAGGSKGLRLCDGALIGRGRGREVGNRGLLRRDQRRGRP